MDIVHVEQQIAVGLDEHGIVGVDPGHRLPGCAVAGEALQGDVPLQDILHLTDAPGDMQQGLLGNRDG